MFDEENDELALRATYGLEREHAAISPIDVATSLTGRAIDAANPSLCMICKMNLPTRSRPGKARTITFVSVRPRQRTRQSDWRVNCYMSRVHEFTAQEIELFSTLANQTALALENANLMMDSMLVREMHHRIKNNLQTVAMLLRLLCATRII